MKINPSRIIADHIATLRDENSGRRSLFDIGIFYLTPIALSVAPYFLNVVFRAEFYNVSITFFGIFIALLLNIQVALFSISQKQRPMPQDERLARQAKEDLSLRNIILREVNANVSYLVLVCTAALFVMLFAYGSEQLPKLFAMVSVAIYAHFGLTLIMIIKRAHGLFQKEYDLSVDR